MASQVPQSNTSKRREKEERRSEGNSKVLRAATSYSFHKQGLNMV